MLKESNIVFQSNDYFMKGILEEKSLTFLVLHTVSIQHCNVAVRQLPLRVLHVWNSAGSVRLFYDMLFTSNMHNIT